MSADRTEPIDRAAGLLVGGDDYIVKPFDPSELLARVRRLFERSATNGTRHRPAPATAGLTRRELEVLTLLALGRRPREIAVELVIGEKTVAGHIQRVLGKLGVNSRAQAVALAYREGLIDTSAGGLLEATSLPGALRRRRRAPVPASA